MTLTLKVHISYNTDVLTTNQPETSSAPKHRKSSLLRGVNVCSALERILAGFKSPSSYLPGRYGPGELFSVPVPQFLLLLTQN